MEIGELKNIKNHLVKIHGEEKINNSWGIIIDAICYSIDIFNKTSLQVHKVLYDCDGKCVIDNTTNKCTICGKEYNEEDLFEYNNMKVKEN